METVLVTGGAGFIGCHTCKALAAAGWLPVAFDNLSRGHADLVRWGPLVKGDILDAVAELARNQRRGVNVEHLVEGRHHAEVHQLPDNLDGLDSHVARKVADGYALGDAHDALGCAWRCDLGLVQFLAGQRAAFLWHSQAAHLALGCDVGCPPLYDLLLFDRAGAGFR